MMKKNILRLVSVLLTLTLVLSLVTACGNKDESKSSTNSNENSVGNTTEAVDDTETPITFSMYSFRTGQKLFPWDESPITKKVTEETGVTIDLEYINSPDVNQKAGIMIASGDKLADFIEPTLTQQNFIDSGSVIPLDDLIEQHAPNIKRLWGDSLNKLRNPKDGKIYFIGNSPGNRQGEIADANQCLLIQYDVLDKLGYPTPKTLDDVEKMLKDYMAIVPDLNGQSFVPFGIWADSWGYNITINNPAQWVNGFTDDSDVYVDPQTYAVKYFGSTSYFKDYLKWLNKMYNQELIDKNAFITKDEQYRALVASGRVLAMIDGTWHIGNSEKALIKAGMPERCYARFPIVNNTDIQDRSQINCESYSWGMSISKDCKDPIRAIKFLDYFASNEGAILLNWGIEGVHYDIIDGKRIIKPEVAKLFKEDSDYIFKEQIGLYAFGQLGAPGSFQSVKLDDGDYATPWINFENVYKNADEWTKKVMDKYNVKYWGQMFDMTGEPNAYGFAWTITNLLPQDGKGSIAAKKADELRHIQIPKIIMSVNDNEFESNWEKFQKKLVDDINIADFETETQQLLMDRLKLWKIVE